MRCRHCQEQLQHVFLDLGFAPPSNAYLNEGDLCCPEVTYPLKLYVCENCWLVQTEDYADAGDLFNAEYAYFSSVSSSWLDHASRYTDAMINLLDLNSDSFVIEVASNDGYLLKNFVAAGVPCLGIEPTASTAAVAEKLGIPVVREFFGRDLASNLVDQGRLADLILGNNVYAHVPDINDFTAGLGVVLKQGGTITLEFPHLLRLIEGIQFDTVYHEHFSYLSLYTVRRIFSKSGLRVFDVEELPTHGGSLRIYGCHDDDARADSDAVKVLLEREEQSGLRDLDLYSGFQAKAEEIKDNLISYLIEQKRAGIQVAAYGAAAKGNTLLNFAGVRADLLSYVCDAAHSKQGKYLPGSHIPIVSPEVLEERKPDRLLILPWNIAPEIQSQNQQVVSWGGKFVVAVPQLKLL